MPSDNRGRRVRRHVQQQTKRVGNYSVLDGNFDTYIWLVISTNKYQTVFSGPLLAPFIGGFINESYLGWRWTEYITAIMGFLGLGLCLLFLEETYPPIILVNKAADLRRRTKNWGRCLNERLNWTSMTDLPSLQQVYTPNRKKLKSTSAS